MFRYALLNPMVKHDRQFNASKRAKRRLRARTPDVLIGADQWFPHIFFSSSKVKLNFSWSIYSRVTAAFGSISFLSHQRNTWNKSQQVYKQSDTKINGSLHVVLAHRWEREREGWDRLCVFFCYSNQNRMTTGEVKVYYAREGDVLPAGGDWL